MSTFLPPTPYVLRPSDQFLTDSVIRWRDRSGRRAHCIEVKSGHNNGATRFLKHHAEDLKQRGFSTLYVDAFAPTNPLVPGALALAICTELSKSKLHYVRSLFRGLRQSSVAEKLTSALCLRRKIIVTQLCY